MHGLDVLQAIVKAKLDVTVIMITGHGTIEDAVTAIKLGAYDFITKPFMPEHLRQMIGRVIERRRLEQERDLLRAERERGLGVIITEKSRLKTVINSMNEGVLITERDKRIVMCNPAFARLMHIPHHHLVGFTLKETSELFPFDQMADELLQNVGDLDVITKVIETEEDRPIYVRASINRIPGEPGETLGLVIVLQDITYFKELEQKKSEFVSMVTHELRAPLGTVDTQLNVVLTGLAGGVTEKQKDLLGRIKSRIGGVLELINNLLDLSKIEARQFVQQKKAMDINPIVQEVINMMEAQAQEKGVTITVQLAADLPQVMMDPLSMSEVITNLLSNAIRYTPTRGHIEVQTGIEANYVQLSVTDTGIGIEAEYLDKIFDRFFRVKNEKTRKIVGTGLGLSIVKAIVDDHLGFVRVQSQPGKGSVFTVLLPMII